MALQARPVPTPDVGGLASSPAFTDPIVGPVAARIGAVKDCQAVNGDAELG